MRRHTVNLDVFESSCLVRMSEHRLGKSNVSAVIADLIQRTDEETYIRWRMRKLMQEFNFLKEQLAIIQSEGTPQRRLKEVIENDDN